MTEAGDGSPEMSAPVRYCTHAGCNRIARGPTLCEMHLARRRRGKPMNAAVRVHFTPEMVAHLAAELPGKSRKEVARIFRCHPCTIDRIRAATGLAPARPRSGETP